MTKTNAVEYAQEVERRAVAKIESLEEQIARLKRERDNAHEDAEQAEERAREFEARLDEAEEKAGDLEFKFSEWSEHDKDRLWKCSHPLCGHVFEADHDKCPECYGT